LNRSTSKLNCWRVPKGDNFSRLEAFCNFSAIKRLVYDVTAVMPVAIDSNQLN